MVESHILLFLKYMASPPCNMQIGFMGISFSSMVSKHPFLFCTKTCAAHKLCDTEIYLIFCLENPEKACKKDWTLLLLKKHQGQLEWKCVQAHNLILGLHKFLKSSLFPFLYHLLLPAVKMSFKSQISGLWSFQCLT